MADISEYLRRQESVGPKRKKRSGEPQTLWNAPTSAAQVEEAKSHVEDKKDEEKQLSPSGKTSSETSSKRRVPARKTSVEDRPTAGVVNMEIGRELEALVEFDADLPVSTSVHVQLPVEIALPQILAQSTESSPLSEGGVQQVVRAPKPRSKPITVGKADSLPAPSIECDLSKDERFLAKYWFEPGPGGLPRSQERFFHFYRFLYSEAVRTNCARVYCTEEMAVETLGPKARGTFTNYRRLGQKYGLFSVHTVGNLGKRDSRPGTYFFLTDPWKS